MEHDYLKIAKEMGLTLKSIKTFEGHDCGLGINADICLNGKAFAHAYDDARGGETDIKPLGTVKKNAQGNYEVTPQLKANRKILEEINEKLAKIPKVETTYPGGSYMMECDLEMIVNVLVDEDIRKKELKKDSKKGIMIDSENGYKIIQWDTTLPTMIRKHGQRMIDMLQKTYNKQIADGKSVLNKDYLKSIGVKI